MGAHTLRIIFGDALTKNYSLLVVNGILIMNDMLLEILVEDAPSWAALNTVMTPINATTYTGTYSTSTIDVSSSYTLPQVINI
jgi:hypothetical protein